MLKYFLLKKYDYTINIKRFKIMVYFKGIVAKNNS